VICPACQAEVEADSVYCPRCGERLEGKREPRDNDEFAAEDRLDDSPATPPAGTPSRSKINAAFPQSQDYDDDTETELWEGGFSPKAMIGSWIGIGLLTIAALVSRFWCSRTLWFVFLGILLLLWIYQGIRLAVRTLGVRYRLTNQRFIHQIGILRRVTDRVEVIDMDDITFEQGLLQQLVGVGVIKITSSDRTHPVLRLDGIDNVQEVADQIDKARRRERVRRGIHIEAV